MLNNKGFKMEIAGVGTDVVLALQQFVISAGQLCLASVNKLMQQIMMNR